MRLIMIIVCCLFFYSSSLSQVVTIVDSSRLVVPYATIEIPKKKFAFFANAKGSTDLSKANISENDTLLISSIGFKTMRIARSSITDWVILQKWVKEMPEVFAYSGKWKQENLGTTKNVEKYNGSISITLKGPGEQVGRKIVDNKASKDIVLLHRVSFLYTHAGQTNAPVRLRIYKVAGDGKPGEDLLTNSIVRNMTTENGWLDFDLNEYGLRMPASGIVVAAEFFNTDSVFWHKETNWMRVNSLGKPEFYTENLLGGSFRVDDNETDCATYKRINGEWVLHDRRWPIKPYWCDNLVVKVWVKYPKE